MTAVFYLADLVILTVTAFWEVLDVFYSLGRSDMVLTILFVLIVFLTLLGALRRFDSFGKFGNFYPFNGFGYFKSKY